MFLIVIQGPTITIYSTQFDGLNRAIEFNKVSLQVEAKHDEVNPTGGIKSIIA